MGRECTNMGRGCMCGQGHEQREGQLWVHEHGKGNLKASQQCKGGISESSCDEWSCRRAI